MLWAPCVREECRTVIAEMEKLKAGANPSHAGPLGDPNCTMHSTGGGLSPLDGASHDGDADILAEAEVGAISPPDPVAVKLAGIVEAALCHISIHTERAGFLQEVHTRVTRSSKVARPNRPAQSHPSHTPLPDGSLSSLLVLLLLLPLPSTQGHLLP